ncbi:MAG: carboxypeptidase regulatory-like domain-containing protein [Acidobacteria bacterium]|nr:carboxypeptidase regulatory-like domain-containing protein [Acidobacteriota bacterium]
MTNGTIREDDRFQIAGITGKVLFRPLGLSPQWVLKSMFIDGVDRTDVGVDVTSLRGDADIRIVLTDKLTDLSGSVQDARGQPAGEYVVIVLPEQPMEGLGATRFTRTARPDQSGTYRLRALPPGRYLAAAVEWLEQGGEWDPEFQRTVRAAGQPLTLDEGQSVVLDLRLATGL